MRFIVLWLALLNTALAQQPGWVRYPAIRPRENGLGNVLADIESHMPAGHIYRDSDLVTWAHETSHGLAGRIRNQWPALLGRKSNGFYCLNDVAALLCEPPTTLQAVALDVPASLRGMSYNLYLVNMTRWWNNQPLYILDEWVAYTNGSETRRDLQMPHRAETVLQMAEFSVYAWSMIRTARQNNYSDPVLEEFARWMTLRTSYLSKGDGQTWLYLLKVRYAADAEVWRGSIRELCGREWCVKAYGF